MKLKHHDLEIELDDAWWAEAGMDNFVLSSNTYRVDSSATRGRSVFEVLIDDVRPLIRNPSVGIFNDNDTASAKDRVISILRGFCSDAAIPPVDVVLEPAGSRFRYKLVAGAHRFYCSLAARFSHVPAVIGFDINADDQ